MRKGSAARLWAALAALVLAAVLALGLASPGAADEGWTIERFDAQIVVRADGSLHVAESIDVDLGSQQKHGIFRRIPVRYHYDDRNDRVYDLRVVSVTDASGLGWKYERSDEGADAVIKIGDPDRTVTGTQTYRIVYDVAGVLNGFADHDELYWNVNGEWPVRTRTLSAHVRLERGAVMRTACYQGPLGSTEACQIAANAGAADARATRTLAEGEQVSVVVAFPKGAVTEPRPRLEARPRDIGQWWDLTPLSAGASAFVLVLGLWLVVSRWASSGRDPRGRDTIVPEYEPPERLRAAEVGLLLDERADTKDLTATIVDLAVRAYLRIEEVPPSGLFGKRDWILHRARPADDGLAAYERRLFEGLFAAGEDVKLSDLRGTFHSTLSAAEGDLYQAAAGAGWFPSDPSVVRNVWLGIGIATMAVGALVAGGLGMAVGAGIVGVAIVAVGVVALAFARAMPRRTAKGRDLLWHVRGFRRYVETAETERSRFAERENIFAQYLPYAIVFGLVSKWAAAFKDVDVQRATGSWYSGGSFGSIAAFSGGLSSFSSGLGTAISSTPGSSGSSGFGGGSGGGGGGGGGGSW